MCVRACVCACVRGKQYNEGWPRGVPCSYACYALLAASGWLTKQGGSGLTPKNWRRRWFVLKAGAVYYYKSPEDNVVRVRVCAVACVRVFFLCVRFLWYVLLVPCCVVPFVVRCGPSMASKKLAVIALSLTHPLTFSYTHTHTYTHTHSLFCFAFAHRRLGVSRCKGT